MKKLVIGTISAVLLAVGLIAFIHWNTIRAMSSVNSRYERLYQRESAIDSMALGLEKYRRLSSNFRKLSPGEILKAKSDLKESFNDNIANLEKLDPTSEDSQSVQRAGDQLANLLKLSDKIEPTLFSRDAYFRPEVREIHDGIMNELRTLRNHTESRISSVNFSVNADTRRSFNLILTVGICLTLIVCLIWVREFVIYYRPLEQLHKFANEIQTAHSPTHANRSFSCAGTGVFGDIYTAMNRMASAVENFSKERHKFIQDVVADLKVPLSLLQSGRNLLNQGQQLTEAQQIHAADSVRKGIAILSGSLEDMSDMENINRLDTLLTEKVVDISELVSDVARTLAGTGPSRQIQTSVPRIPVWALVDPRRMERVLVQSITKISSTLPEGGKVLVSISDGEKESSPLGMEITIQDASKSKNTKNSSGPDVEILRHWISEGGLGMMLVYKTMKALGGTAMASGVAGTGARIILRLPRSRIVNRGLISAPEEIPAGLTTLSQTAAAPHSPTAPPLA